MTVMQSFRDEHAHLLPHIDHLREVADTVGEAPHEALTREVAEAHTFLTERLIPHAEAEDAWLYPAVARLMGAPQATATMRRDHVEVGRLTAELGDLLERLRGEGLGASLAKDVRRVLYGLHALVAVHFAKEEEVYLPLLEDRLSPEEAQELVESMHGAGHTHHH
jgi:iron-sulfur cluster repair protein YtfE (RIC family)